jgi:hypothetical protein
MEAVRTSEMSVNFNMTTRRYIPEDSKLQGVQKLAYKCDNWSASICGGPGLCNCYNSFIHVMSDYNSCPAKVKVKTGHAIKF